MTLRVAVAGASGYVGGELLRLIANHPELELATVTAGENSGEKLGQFHPHLSKFFTFSAGRDFSPKACKS